MGLFGSIKKAASKVQKTVRSSVEKVTDKTPLKNAVRSVTRASITDPKSMLKAASTITTAVTAISSGGLATAAKSAASNAVRNALTPQAPTLAAKSTATAVKMATPTVSAQAAAAKTARAESGSAVRASITTPPDAREQEIGIIVKPKGLIQAILDAIGLG